MRVGTVNILEAKTHFSRLIARVERGERIVIGRAGKPVAVLIPYAELPAVRVSERDEGEIHFGDDFDEPLAEFQD